MKPIKFSTINIQLGPAYAYSIIGKVIDGANLMDFSKQVQMTYVRIHIQEFCTFVIVKKVLYIFFAVYFSMLAFVPCTDSDSCEDDCMTKMCQNNSSNHEEETCPPFCVCNCCAAHFYVTHFEEHFISYTPEKEYYNQPTSSKVTGAVIPVWQPPKLV